MQCLKESYTLISFCFAQVTVPDRCSLLTPWCCILALASFTLIKSVAAWDAMHANQKTAKTNMSHSTFFFLEEQFCRFFFFWPFFSCLCSLLSLSLPSEGYLLIPIIDVAHYENNSICRLLFTGTVLLFCWNGWEFERMKRIFFS